MSNRRVLENTDTPFTGEKHTLFLKTLPPPVNFNA
jgi:hypothetical protein